MNKKILLSMFILSIFLFSFANVSATLETKSFDEDYGKYGKIKINDYLFLNKVDYTLTDYGSSIINVWAEGEYEMYKDTHLFTGIFYKDILGNKGVLNNVRFYIWNEEKETRYDAIYENQNCYLDTEYTEEEWLYGMLINDTFVERCERVLISNESYEVDISGWIPYEKGMEIEDGKGRWRLQAERPINQRVDFVLEAHGEEFIEWAWLNDSWEYKREISNLTSYISFLEINKTSNMQPNFGDVRFATTDATIELNYTIEAQLDGQGLAYNSSLSPYNSGLVSYYKLDEQDITGSGTIYDETGSNNGTNNGASNVTGKINTAYDFDGSSSYIYFDSGISGDTTVSVSGWFKTSSSGRLVSINNNNLSSHSGFYLGIDSGVFALGVEGVNQLTGTTTVNDDVWHFFVLTRNGDIFNVYLDGNPTPEVTLNQSGGTYGSYNYFCRSGYIGIPVYYNGTSDEIAIWSRILSTSENSKLYNASYAQFRVNNLGEESIDMYYGNSEVNTTENASNVYYNPVSAYYFDANANDFVGSNHGNVSGATLSSGYINNSYLFDGINDVISYGTAWGISATDPYTFSFQIKRSAEITTGAENILQIEYPSSGYLQLQYQYNGGSRRIEYAQGLAVIDYGITLGTSDWYNIAVQKSGTTSMLWIDGINVANGTGGSTGGAGTDIAYIGGSSGYWEGNIDEVRIYNQILTEEQILSLGNETSPQFIEGAEQTANNPPTITANATKPDIVYSDTDYLVNLTVEDIDVGDTLTAYTQFYVNGTLTSTEQSTIVVNGTNTLVATLSSGNFTHADILTAQVWAGDGTVNTTKVNLTSSQVAYSPSITSLTEYPSDPATYSQSTIYEFNSTVIDMGVLDTVSLEFNGTNYTATNLSASIFNVSITNLSAGIYYYTWFANNSAGGINNTENGNYTVNKETSQTSLTFSIPSPQTYGTPVTPTCSATVGDGATVLEMDGVVITSGVAIVIGAGTKTFNCSYLESENYTGSQNISTYTIDKAVPEGALTSSIGWIINESQEVTIGYSEGNPNDGDVSYIIYRDNVSKGSGETWSPAYGIYYYILNTTGGANWTANASMDTQTLIVGDNLNPNLEIVYPENDTIYPSVITELNYTVYDLNLDMCWYSLDGGLNNITVTCGDNVTGLDSGQGFSTWQIWANDSDSNINTTSVTFCVDSVPPNVTELTEYPSDPAIYSQETIYQFNATILDCSNLNTVLLEFNGVNYTATNISSNVFNVSLVNLSVGTYNYRWFANDSVGNFNNSESGSYTINKATPSLNLTATTPIIYGTATNFVGSGCPLELNCTLDIENNVYAAGNITANYSTPGNENYTSAYSNFTVVINKATLSGSISGLTPINYTNVANITANETNNNDSDVTYILYRNNVTISNPDNTVLGVGTYYYIYNSTGGENYSANPSIDTFTLNVEKATAEVYAYVGNKRANYVGNNLTAKNEYLNGSLNVGLGDIKMYLNNSLINSGPSPLFNILDFPLGSYYFNVTYDGNENYTSAEEHWSINISVWFLSNLTGVFNLNAGDDDIAYDISGNNNNGTIEGATWYNDGIDINLLENFDYSVNSDTGLFVFLNRARDMTLIQLSYVYFEYDDNSLESIIIKIVPGLLLLLILIMIIRLIVNREDNYEETYVYDY